MGGKTIARTAIIKKAPDRNSRILAASVFLGLITYYIHGAMNNFLDTDKASAPFWGLTAVLVSMDIFAKGNNHSEEENSEKLHTKN